ncbi:MAG: amidohydrolase, partial [Deltaproteobacteria bacterium]|nr:amidohydrolase [Deltaproteobacteria bacterium]
DQIGNDVAEYIELYNAGGAPAPLAALKVYLVNGNGNSSYASYALGEGELLPGAYLLLRGKDMAEPAGCARHILMPAARDNVQNGAPDAIALVDTSNGTVIDALSYEGCMNDVSLAGLNGRFDVCEGLGSPVARADSNAVSASLSRFPDGLDTDANEGDFVLTGTLTPCTVNVQDAL